MYITILGPQLPPSHQTWQAPSITHDHRVALEDLPDHPFEEMQDIVLVCERMPPAHTAKKQSRKKVCRYGWTLIYCVDGY